MELLSDILRAMRVRGSVYFCDHPEAPWSMEFRDRDSASFHLVRRGECWVALHDEVERLGPGDLLFVGPRVDHVLGSHPPGEAPEHTRSATLLLCGYFQFDMLAMHPLVESFPSLTIVREKDLLQHTWLKGTLDQLSAEYLSQKPGSEVVVDKLTEVLLVELIRINFGRSEQSRFIQALSDKQIARALNLLHAKPQASWTLDSLASEVAMSRATFASRFKELVGRTMFEYLTALRMERAQELLRTSEFPLYEVARRAGYESDLAFTKAFKRRLGITPTMYRKTAKADSDRANQHTTATQIESVGRRLRARTVKLTTGS